VCVHLEITKTEDVCILTETTQTKPGRNARACSFRHEPGWGRPWHGLDASLEGGGKAAAMSLSRPATQTTPVRKPLGASAHRVWPRDGARATVCIMMLCIRAAVIVGCATPMSHVASSWRTPGEQKISPRGDEPCHGSLCLTKEDGHEEGMDRGRTLKMNRGSGLLVLSAVAAGLGNSLDSISVLSFIAPALALLSLACLTSFEWEHRGGSPVPTGPLPWRISSGDVPSVARTDARVAYAYALFIGAQSLGFALGFAAALVPDMPLATSVIGVWVCGLGIWSLMTGLVYLPTLRLWARLGPESLLRIYVFPLLHATVSIAIIGRTISTFQVPAASVVDIAPLRMLGSVFGLIGIDWVVSLSAALISEHTLYLVGAPAQASLLVLSPRALPRASFLALGQLMLLLVMGGIFEKAPGMWQETIAKQVASSSSINASCLIHRRQPSGGEDGGWMGEQTALRIAALDDIIVWSEEAAVVETEAEEDTLISSVRAMLAGSSKTYVALNYLKKVGVYGNYSNLSVLMCPKGKIAWYKAKAYPVPVVEAEVCEYS
jgi:hypothetical protein